MNEPAPVPPTTISDETVEAAATAIYDEAGPESIDRDGAEAFAVAALAAVVPYIEAGLRAKISDELMDDGTLHDSWCDWSNSKDGHGPGCRDFSCSCCVAQFARVARGTQEATNG